MPNNSFEGYRREISEIKRGGEYQTVVFNFRFSEVREYQASNV